VPEKVEQILSAINHLVASSWFSSLRLHKDARTNKHTSNSHVQLSVCTSLSHIGREGVSPVILNLLNTEVLLSPYHDQEGNKLHSPHFMEL